MFGRLGDKHMCTVSMVGDDWSRRIPQAYPWVQPAINPTSTVYAGQTVQFAYVSQYEFDKLKSEVESLKQLLIAAKKYDDETGQPDCEVDEKVELIRRIAQLVGVDISSVFGDKP